MVKKLASLLLLFFAVSVSAQTSSQIEANKGVLKLAPTAQLPAPTCRLGQLWFDTTTATVKLCDDGANWVAVGGGVPSATIENGVTGTSGCVAGGVLRSISNLVDCGAGFTYASGVAGIGTASTTSGALRIFNSGHAFYTEFTIGTQAGNLAYVLPTALGSAGEVLTDVAGNGVLSWEAGGGGGVTIGDTQVAYATSANTLGGDAGMIYTSASDLLTLLGGTTVGSTTTAGTATTATSGTISGASATSNFFNSTGTFNATLSAETTGALFSYTGDNDAQAQSAVKIQFTPVLTTIQSAGALSVLSNGNVGSAALYAENSGSGSGVNAWGAVGRTSASAVGGRFIGGYFGTEGTTGLSWGVIGSSSGAGANTVGVTGIADSDATAAVGVWGYLTASPGQYKASPTAPTGKAAMIADNTSIAADIFCGRDNGTDVFCIGDGGDVQVVRTLTAGGTTGARTINLPQGSVNFAATDTTLVVTNSMAATTSLIFLTPQTADTTCIAFSAVRAAGSFTITANAACTAETTVAFWVTNTP